MRLCPPPRCLGGEGPFERGASVTAHWGRGAGTGPEEHTAPFTGKNAHLCGGVVPGSLHQVPAYGCFLQLEKPVWTALAKALTKSGHSRKFTGSFPHVAHEASGFWLVLRSQARRADRDRPPVPALTTQRSTGPVTHFQVLEGSRVSERPVCRLCDENLQQNLHRDPQRGPSTPPPNSGTKWGFRIG